MGVATAAGAEAQKKAPRSMLMNVVEDNFFEG